MAQVGCGLITLVWLFRETLQADSLQFSWKGENNLSRRGRIGRDSLSHPLCTLDRCAREGLIRDTPRGEQLPTRIVGWSCEVHVLDLTQLQMQRGWVTGVKQDRNNTPLSPVNCPVDFRSPPVGL